jgi:TonB-linked SusC/RagA family outer membrane protein
LDHVLRGKGISYEIRRDKVIVLSKVQKRERNDVMLPLPPAVPESIWVKGQVTDEKGGALPGVSVLLKGTTRGSASDANGNFSIEVPDQNAVLVFSFVGYVSSELRVGSRTDWNISLKEDEKALEELVVVGFGERNRRDLTGSISTVNADLIGKSGAASPQYALQGNATGVRVINTSGNPNDAPQIFIRGVGTWNGDSQPLYVVDGQILEPPRAGNEDLISGGGLRTPPNLFNLINAGDIESISVLKDASAAAVYGSRAANGVVLITTKRGKKGAPKLEFNTRVGIQNSPRYKLLNTTQFINLAEEMYANTANPDITIGRNLYGRDEPNDAIRLTTYNPQFDPQSPYYISDRTTYDWQDQMVRSNALNQAYDVKVSGANDRIDYYVSAGLLDHEGVIYGNNLKRLTGAINLNIKVTDWAKIGINYKYTRQETKNNRADLPDIADVAPWQRRRSFGNRRLSEENKIF